MLHILVVLCGLRVWGQIEKKRERERDMDRVNVTQKLSGLVMTEVWKAIGPRPESPHGCFSTPQGRVNISGHPSRIPPHSSHAFCQSLAVSKLKEWEMSYPCGTLIQAPLHLALQTHAGKKKWRKLKVTHSFRVARSAFLNTSTVCPLLKAHLKCVCSRGCLLHSNEKHFGLRFNPAQMHSIHVWPRTRLQLLTYDRCYE